MKSFLQGKWARVVLCLALVASILSLLYLYQPWQAQKVRAASGGTFSPLPLVTQSTLDSGNPGGEGGQWIRSGMGISPADANFMLVATDVGGILRSLDGGAHWRHAMVGWNARGGLGFAFDPHNANRVLGVGGNGLDDPSNNQPNGVYLSTNKGDSWTQVLPKKDGPDWHDTMIAYDPSSYDSSAGYTKVAYYITRNSGLYKTTDGGSTWNQINTQFTGYGGFRIAVHPTQGYVYITSNENPDYGTANGFYKSTDGGTTFTKTADGYTLGLTVSAAAPNKVYVSRWDRVLVSNDSGQTFQQTPNQGLPTDYTHPLENVTASPADANYLSVWWAGDNYQWHRYYSKDGGATWGDSQYGDSPGLCGENSRAVQNSILPCNVRNGVWAYHPTNPNIVFSTGGDWITKSTDGGATYKWQNNGYVGIFSTPFSINPNSPNTVALGSKDYNAFVTTNGGTSWRYSQLTYDFGGYAYGAFALDQNVVWVGDDEKIDASGDPILKVSTDGGSTWTTKMYNGEKIAASTNAQKYNLVSYADPTNNDIGFIGKWRTTDHANSWAPMTGVEMVLTSNPTGAKELYGRNGNDIVKSTDHGASWSSVGTVTGGFRDLAYDHLHNRFWLASEDQVKKFENGQVTTVSIPTDQYGTVRSQTVAVDPGNPDVVYAGNNRDLWASSNSLVRSTDGGSTWENLTVNESGPREVWWVRVHPQTHEAWLATNCFGMWKFSPSNSNQPGTGLKGDYFNNRDVSGNPAHTRTDATVDFDWGYIPAPNTYNDNFSVRWTGKVKAPTTGSYTFSLSVNDGARLWVNGQLVIDYWNDNRNNWGNYSPVTRTSNTINLNGGTQYDIKLEFYDNAYAGTARLSWSYPGQGTQIIPQSSLYPAA